MGNRREFFKKLGIGALVAPVLMSAASDTDDSEHANTLKRGNVMTLRSIKRSQMLAIKNPPDQMRVWVIDGENPGLRIYFSGMGWMRLNYK